MNLQEKYSQNKFINWLQTKLFVNSFEKDRYLEPVAIERKTSYFVDNNCFYLGEIKLDEKIAVWEIEQKSSNDPRITLTKDAFKLMADNGVNYALVIFKSKDSLNYRLSLLMSKQYWDEKEESNPQRFSFLLGKGEKTKTPERIFNKEINSWPELVECFDVEVVRKEFFDKYLVLFLELYQGICTDEKFINLLKNKIDVVTFTKNLLGKIVFLYFVQKKGWLGVPKEGQYWKDGDTNFMRSLWNIFKADEKTLLERENYFYNDCLEWLFYDGLNKNNSDIYDFNSYFNQKVPYLNGGLFKEDYQEWRNFVAKIPNEIFSNKTEKEDGEGILDVFDVYNFTIDEDDLYDKEVAVDPEMLGKIFEKMISISSDNIEEILLEYEKNKKNGRKKKITIDNILNKKLGAFYTPREIVHYMTKESLIAYLVNNLKGKRAEKEEKIRKLFEYKEKYLTKHEKNLEEEFDQVGDFLNDVIEKLNKVKILDPAIGSGAFPMGILHEISTLKFYIFDVFYRYFELLDGSEVKRFVGEKEQILMYEIKKEIILNNIYGVDISAGAIDIARLRFWLSLVLEEEQPEPLPNFEFKFVCANTLIPLAEEGLFDSIDEEKLRENMRNFYNLSSKKKKNNLEEKIKFILSQASLFASDKEKQFQKYDPFDSNASASFFDMNLMFGIKRGEKFDIIIGNPPYIKEYENRKAFEKIKGKPYYLGKMDIWYYFACYGLDLLKEGGIESFIAQNNWITSFGAKKMRNKILEDAKIKEFIDFGDFKVFENVGIQTMIYILEKNQNNLSYEVKYSKLNNKKFDEKRIERFLLDNKGCKDYKKHFSKIEKKKYIDKTLDFVNGEISEVLDKIFNSWDFKLNKNDLAQWIVYPQDYLNEKNKYYLDDKVNIWDGIFILSDKEKISLNLESEEKELLKRAYTTKQLGRYYADSNNLEWVIYTNSSFKNKDKIKNYPNIKNHLDKFKKVITSDNKPYWLHRARNEDFFIGKKIIATRKCVKPAFSYVDFDSYVSATFYVMKTDRINLKYLTGLLNSKLIEFWLKNKGKMQGENFQLDKEPLLNIPIKQIPKPQQTPLISKVDQLLAITSQTNYNPKNLPQEQKDLEKEIDEMVYELYGLTAEEIGVVENN